MKEKLCIEVDDHIIKDDDNIHILVNEESMNNGFEEKIVDKEIDEKV